MLKYFLKHDGPSLNLCSSPYSPKIQIRKREVEKDRGIHFIFDHENSASMLTKENPKLCVTS